MCSFKKHVYFFPIKNNSKVYLCNKSSFWNFIHSTTPYFYCDRDFVVYICFPFHTQRNIAFPLEPPTLPPQSENLISMAQHRLPASNYINLIFSYKSYTLKKTEFGTLSLKNSLNFATIKIDDGGLLWKSTILILFCLNGAFIVVLRRD